MWCASLLALLRAPVSRFLRHLWIDLSGSNPSLDLDMPFLLAEPGVCARPWVIVVGDPVHRRVLRRRYFEGRELHRGRAVFEPSRELRAVYIDGRSMVLPWFEGRKEQRVAGLESLVLEGAAPHTLTRFARALDDPQLAVRFRGLDRVPELGLELAPFIPELARMIPIHLCGQPAVARTPTWLWGS